MNKKRQMDRREFLRQSGIFAAGTLTFPTLVASSVLAENGTMPPSDKITMAVIGVGGRGVDNMRNFLNHTDARVVAVCDVQEKLRQRAKAIVDQKYGDKGCAMYNDFREVLSRRDIDSVMVTTQDHWHGLIAVAAARAGKDLYCEKPLGVAVFEGQAIRDAVRKHKRVLQTGTQQRSDRKFRVACELARNGYLGKIHTIHVGAPGPEYKRTYDKPTTEEPIPPGLDYDMYVGPSPMKPYNGGRLAWPDWYLIWDYCAGFIVNWGVHHLDIANWGCPAVSSEPCEFAIKGNYRNDGLTDNINDWRGEFRYASGLRMTYSDTGNPNRIGCEFVGDKGSVYVDRAGIWAKPESLLKIEIKPEEHLYVSNDHYSDFLKCVRSRKDPVSPVEEGHKASYLGLIAETAVRLNRKLKWDPVKEEFPGDSEANALNKREYRKPWAL